MGSSFFKSGLDPIGSLVGRVAGPNSFVAKAAAYDPLASSSFGKAVSPTMYNLGQQYANRHNVPVTQSPYAGVQPTLQDANNGYGYVQQSQRMAQPRPVGQSPYSV